MNSHARQAHEWTCSEVLGAWLQSLEAFDVCAVFILGPAAADTDGAREVLAVSPESFRSTAQAVARSHAYGIRWRQAKGPLVASRNFACQPADDERRWVELCVQNGASSLVRVDFPTALDHGFESVMLCAGELAEGAQVHAMAYSAQVAWPLLKEHVIARRLGVSSREQEVLLMLAKGHTAKEAGVLLGCTERTVTFHTTNIMNKLQARNQRSLILRACSLGLI